MNANTALDQDREFEFTDTDFTRLRELVALHTGINLSDTKRTLVYSRLSGRLRKLGLTRFREYCEIIEQGDVDELESFSNAISTNLTAFFREPHHFDYLSDSVLPQIFADQTRSKRLRIWSTAASTGEEPYSIAMVLKEAMPITSNWDVKILATDIDTRVLETAKKGVYGEDRTSGLAARRQQRWFNKVSDAGSNKLQVVPELREMITFKPLNLLRDWPMKGPFDIVFCRNVVIYFDKPTQRTLFQRISELMPPATHLFIGHSETLYKVSDQFNLIGKTIYQRN